MGRELRFTWDEAKRLANLEKHGVDFKDADGFDWSRAIVREDDRYDYGERRFIAIGRMPAQVHVLVFTPRAGAVRVISLRKANAMERERYEQG